VNAPFAAAKGAVLVKYAAMRQVKQRLRRREVFASQM